MVLVWNHMEISENFLSNVNKQIYSMCIACKSKNNLMKYPVLLQSFDPINLGTGHY